MHMHSIDAFQHEHVFLGVQHDRNARRVWIVVALTFATMLGEIAGGTLFGSLALIADGWHMSTHAAALAISALAYGYARRHVHDPRFAFGTGKFGDLASFTSAIILAMIALFIGYESVERLFHPVSIFYNEAIAIAALGLAVNLGSAWLLRGGHAHHYHGHDHDRAHDDHAHHRHGSHSGHDHAAHDLNLRAAYIHVLADAMTSVLAILGLLTAKWFDWSFIDPLVGLAGTGVILSWAYGLVFQAGGVLIDSVPDQNLVSQMKNRLETGGDRVSDLHLWRVGPGHYAAVLSIISDRPQAPAAYKSRLAGLSHLSHVTVEVEQCLGGC